MFDLKKILPILLGLTFFFLVPIALLSEEIIAQSTNSKLLWADNQVYYSTQADKIMLPASSKDKIALLPSGERVLFTQNEDMRLVIYNHTKNEFYKINLNNDPGIDEFYSAFELSPEKDKLKIYYTWGNMPGVNNLIYDLSKLDVFINKLDTTGLAKDRNNLIYIGDKLEKQDIYFSIESLIIQQYPKVKKDHFFVQNFKWLKDNQFQFETNDLLIQNTWQADTVSKQLTNLGPYSPFSDLKSSDPDFEIVLRAKAEGWLKGYPDGTVKLDSSINRAEFVKIMIQAFDNKEAYEHNPRALWPIFEQEPPKEIPMICPDAPAGVWYSPSFYVAKELGVIEGYPEEGKDKKEWLCKPGNTINKAEALKVVLRLLRKADSSSDTSGQYADTLSDVWYSPYTAWSNANGLFRTGKDNKLNPGAPLTRREMIYLTIRIEDIEIERTKGG